MLKKSVVSLITRIEETKSTSQIRAICKPTTKELQHSEVQKALTVRVEYLIKQAVSNKEVESYRDLLIDIECLILEQVKSPPQKPKKIPASKDPILDLKSTTKNELRNFQQKTSETFVFFLDSDMNNLLKCAERETIRLTLLANGLDITKSAKILGITKRTLHCKLDRYFPIVQH